MKKITALLSLFFYGYLSPAYAEVKVFKPTFPDFYDSAATRKQNNKFYSLGTATFADKVSVPFYAVTALNPVDDGLLKIYEPCKAKNCHFNFKLTAEHASQLKLLAIPSIGTVLVPRSWQDIQANAGANGSGFALIMSPDRKQVIELYDSSFCVGCGMPSATLYFPELLKKSVENEFGGYKDSLKHLSVVHPSPHTAFFSYQIPGVKSKTHGVAKYDDEDSFNFREIHVSLSQENQSLARPILNFYHATH